MLTGLLIQGIIIGILVSIPMGPIGVLCIQRTLHQGRRSGFISGLGAASADSFFAAIAGFGLTFISNFFKEHQFVIMLTGALVLVFFGLKLFFTNAIKQIRKYRLKKSNPVGDYFSVFFLTLSNPITILFFGIVFAGLGVVKDHPEHMAYVLIGIFSGAILYWFFLSSIVNAFRKYFRLRIIFWINKVAGVLIILFGVGAAINAFYPEISQEHLENNKIIQMTSKVTDSID